jgi:hypothetical protein
VKTIRERRIEAPGSKGIRDEADVERRLASEEVFVMRPEELLKKNGVPAAALAPNPL